MAGASHQAKLHRRPAAAPLTADRTAGLSRGEIDAVEIHRRERDQAPGHNFANKGFRRLCLGPSGQ